MFACFPERFDDLKIVLQKSRTITYKKFAKFNKAICRRARLDFFYKILYSILNITEMIYTTTLYIYIFFLIFDTVIDHQCEIMYS